MTTIERAALEQLAANALPEGAAGAWIRAVVREMLAADAEAAPTG